jgi:hypothetical protein
MLFPKCAATYRSVGVSPVMVLFDRQIQNRLRSNTQPELVKNIPPSIIELSGGDPDDEDDDEYDGSGVFELINTTLPSSRVA